MKQIFNKQEVVQFRSEYGSASNHDEFVRKIAVSHRCSITAVINMLAGRREYAEFDKETL